MTSVDLTPVLQLALFALAAILAVLAAAVAARHMMHKQFEQRRELREAKYRPVIMRALAEDEPDLSLLDEVSGAERRTLESLVWSLLPKVRGTSRDALVVWLDRSGAIRRAQQQTRSFGSVRRAAAAERLGSAGMASTASDVERLLTDRTHEVRLVAARALGKLGQASAVPALLDSLGGSHPVPANVVTMALIHIGPSVEPELIKSLARDNVAARSVCVDLLGLHGSLPAAKHLIVLLQYDNSAVVRTHVAASLGRLGLPQAIEPLSRALRAGNETSVRVAAATALGEVGGHAALNALQIALNDVEDEVGVAAACALMRLGAAGEEILEAAAAGDGPAVGRSLEWHARMRLQAGVRRRRDRTAAVNGVARTA